MTEDALGIEITGIRHLNRPPECFWDTCHKAPERRVWYHEFCEEHAVLADQFHWDVR